MRVTSTILATLLGATLTLASSQALADDKTIVRLGGYPEILEQHDLTEFDATINFELTIEEMFEGDDLDARVEMYDTPQAAREAFRNGELDAVFGTTLDYFSIQEHVALDHIYTLSWDGAPTLTYVLLTNQQAGKKVNRLNQLNNKELSLGVGTNLAALILDTHLKASGRDKAGVYFKSVKRVRNSQTAIIDLMFQKTDAALVPSLALDRARETNPQTRKLLNVVFESEQFVPGVIVFHKSLSADALASASAKFLRLGEYDAGQQLLDLFHAKEVVRVQPSDFHNVQNLLAAK